MNVVFFHITVISLLLISCGFYKTEIIDDNQKGKNLVSMEMVKQILEDQISIKRQEPFLIREFNPYLDREWIGKAVSYGFYRKGQAPNGKGPNEEQILEDLEIILNYWNLIRIYGSDENSERVLRVIRENNLPVKVMLGVWLEDEKDNSQREKENIAEVLNAIRLANEYSEIISAINVGNETQVFWSAHKMDMEKLIHYIRVIRNNTNVPVTTADDYNFWNKHESKSVADEVDFIVVHIYPLWNGQTLDNSIEWMSNIFFNDIKKFHTDKTLVLGEIGWATNYDVTKIGDGQQGSLIKGEVSYAAQEKFLLKLNRWIDENKVTTFLFEAFDEPWKGGGEYSSPDEIEKHWGVFYENRTPKPSFKNFLKVYQTGNK